MNLQGDPTPSQPPPCSLDVTEGRSAWLVEMGWSSAEGRLLAQAPCAHSSGCWLLRLSS